MIGLETNGAVAEMLIQICHLRHENAYNFGISFCPYLFVRLYERGHAARARS
jgi:hypothetical protein